MCNCLSLYNLNSTVNIYIILTRPFYEFNERNARNGADIEKPKKEQTTLLSDNVPLCMSKKGANYPSKHSRLCLVGKLVQRVYRRTSNLSWLDVIIQ